MKLYMPTKVYNEKGCVRQHSQELAELGTKALLVTGKHSSRVNGSLQDVEDALNREQVPYVIFDGIEENPSVETVMRATALGLSEKVDFVIGIGSFGDFHRSQGGRAGKTEHQPPYFPRACIGGFYVSADCFQNRLYQHGGGYVSTSGGEPFKHERYALQPCLQRDGSADLCKGKGCARFL